MSDRDNSIAVALIGAVAVVAAAWISAHKPDPPPNSAPRLTTSTRPPPVPPPTIAPRPFALETPVPAPTASTPAQHVIESNEVVTALPANLPQAPASQRSTPTGNQIAGMPPGTAVVPGVADLDPSLPFRELPPGHRVIVWGLHGARCTLSWLSISSLRKTIYFARDRVYVSVGSDGSVTFIADSNGGPSKSAIVDEGHNVSLGSTSISVTDSATADTLTTKLGALAQRCYALSHTK